MSSLLTSGQWSQFATHMRSFCSSTAVNKKLQIYSTLSYTYVFFLKVFVRLEHFTSLLLALINQSAELRECRRSLHSTMTLRNEHWLWLRHFTSNSYVKHYRIRKTYLLRKYVAAKKTVMTWNSCNLKSFK